MKMAKSIAKTSVSSQQGRNEYKGQVQNYQALRGNKQRIKPQIPKWKLKNQFKTFDDLLILIDKFGYLSDDEKNKSKFSNIRQHMWAENKQQQPSKQQTQSNQQQAQTSSNQNQNTNKNDDNNKQFPKKSKSQSEKSKKSKVIVRKPTLDELKLVQNSPNDLIEDALQFEAFHFWISQIECCRSPIFSLSPILSYYLYSILLLNMKGARELMQNDNQLLLFKRYLKQKESLVKLIKSYFSYKSEVIAQDSLDLEDYQAFLSIIPQNITIQDIDFDIIMDDFTLYSQQYIDYLKKGDKISQIGKLLINNKNNVVLGFIGFNFINQEGENIKFRYPISKFDKDQCLVYFEIMDARKLLEQVKRDYNQQLQLMKFINKKHFYSEMAMLLWLIQDAINDYTIFNQLWQSLIKNTQELILKSIQLDITSKNKICDGCVNMFNTFPIKFYCEQMIKTFPFKFRIKNELYLIINSQFYQDPQYKEGEQIYMDPIIIEVINKQVITEQYEEEQIPPQQQDFNQIQQTNDQNQIIQASQQEVQEQQEVIQFNSLQQQEQVMHSQEIEQQNINQGQQFVQQQEKISYFVIQLEQEITGLISEQMFNYRYRRNDVIKKKIFEISLENTFFASSCNDEDKSKLGQSSEGSQQQVKSLQSSEKIGKNRLFVDLQKIEQFKKIKEMQLEKISLNQQIVERRKIITQQKLIDDFKTKSFVSLATYYCNSMGNKNFKKFQIKQLNYLIQYVIFQNATAGIEENIFQQLSKNFTDHGIIFNEKVDKRLLLNDYLFFKQRITPYLGQVQSSEINNEFTSQLFQFNNTKQAWLIHHLDIQFPKIISNCKEFFKIIRLSLQQVCQEGEFKYYLLICNLYEIDKRCKQYLEDQINQDDFLNKLDITIHFESINLIIDKQNQKQQTIQVNQQQQGQKEIRFEKSNLLNSEIFLNRYSYQGDFEKKSFNDTQDLIQNFSCFNCQDHDKFILKQTQKEL